MNELFLYGILNSVFILAVSPLFMGIIKKVKAAAGGRRGPPLMQQYYTLGKLFRKENLVSSDSSWITRATPYFNIAAIVTAALCVPLLFAPSDTTILGNFILLIYLLALAKFFMALSGLDAGSTFGGMGSSREMSISAVVEPVIIIIFLALAFVFKTFNMFDIFKESATRGIFSIEPGLILLALALFVMLIAETSRIPVDNPETHLELTMIHEGMLLENSGSNLALMEISHGVKQTIFMALLINIFLPFGFSLQFTLASIALAAVFFLAKGASLAVVVALFESSIAKSRLFRLPTLMMIPFFLSFLTIIIEVFS